MSLTQTQVISNALSLLGQKPVLSIQGNLSDIVQVAVQAYNTLIRSILSKAPWRFACKIAQLSQHLEAPPGMQWRYIYQLPGDLLRLVRVLPYNQEFELFANNQLYCNIGNEIYVEYVGLTEQTSYPDYFNEYLIYEIACHLALTSAQSAQYLAPLRAERDYKMAVAMATDAQNRPNTPFLPGGMITARMGGVL